MTERIVPHSSEPISISRERRSEVVGGARDRVERVVLFAGDRVDRATASVAVRVVVRHLEVDARVVDRDAQVGLGDDVVDALAPVPERAAVAQRRSVLVSCSQPHAALQVRWAGAADPARSGRARARL